ncbi:putative reverse transcriptase domain-containing protein [Tanacetum coccineum]|uniref:Reverse transcriptase domain-containing protein n=1 Tax=Tanacetum coccineum TaxID=301880 RepID=A0ABQ5IHG4_9ASTR
MPFGLTNVPVSKEEHEVYLKLILELLEKEKLFGKFSKCEFWLQELHFLRHVVNSEGKANVVANALSRKEWMKPIRVRALSMTIHSSIKARILEAHNEASKDVNTPAEMLRGLDKQTLIMDEAHNTKYYVHPGADKMYYDLRDLYWWPGIKKDIAMTSSGHDMIWVIVDRLTKSAHFLAIREDYQMERFTRLYINEIIARHGVPMTIISDHDSRFASSYHSSVKCALFEALYGRKCKTPIAKEKLGESKLIGLEIVQDTTNKIVQIMERLKTARDRQKSYADNRRKPLEFNVGEKVLLKVSPWKGIVRIHDTFHVSNLKKCLADVNFHVLLEEFKIDKGLHFVEEPIEVMDRDVKKLKQSKIPIVKVCWNSRRGLKFTWEREDEMKRKFVRVHSFECISLMTPCQKGVTVPNTPILSDHNDKSDESDWGSKGEVEVISSDDERTKSDKEKDDEEIANKEMVDEEKADDEKTKEEKADDEQAGADQVNNDQEGVLITKT